jgi:hypothetical protein
VEVRCALCGKAPDEIDEYVVAAAVERMTPEEYVREEEGTLNPETGRFWCTECYITLGMPLGVVP